MNTTLTMPVQLEYREAPAVKRKTKTWRWPLMHIKTQRVALALLTTVMVAFAAYLMSNLRQIERASDDAVEVFTQP